jgi:hypothetical protein
LPFSTTVERVDQVTKTDLSKNLEYFGGIFDASSMGIYFTGEDPRNANGYIRLFAKLDHPIPVHKYVFAFNNLTLFATYNEVAAKVFSLHIHSKDLRLFDVNQSSSRLDFLVQHHLLGERLESQGFKTFKIKAWDLMAKVYVRSKLRFF